MVHAVRVQVSICAYKYWMAQRNREYDQLLKFVIVGESSVGKSCLLLRFSDDQFNENYMTTIGVDFRFKTVTSNNKNIKLQIWDTAGQERFRTITNTYYKNAHAVFLVYDITNFESFESIDHFWLNQVQSYADPGTKMVLVGNKSDLRAEQTVPTERAAQYAESKNMMFFETSAKTADHVTESFMNVTSSLVRDLQKNAIKKKEPAALIDLNQKRAQTSKGVCC